MSINPALFETYKGSKGHAELNTLLEAHREQPDHASAENIRIHSEPLSSLLDLWTEAQENYLKYKSLYHEREAQYKKEDSDRWSSWMAEHKNYMKDPRFDAVAPELDDELWAEYTQKHYDFQIELWEKVMHYQLLRQDFEKHYIHEDMHHLL